MTAPRSVLVSLQDTPWYHVYSRVVRRAWLCGEDAFSGKNFDHRRGWIAERIAQLAAIFAIDVAAYAILSSHYHIVLRVDRERALGWSTEAVLQRWTQLFSGPFLVQRYLSDARSEMTEERTLWDIHLVLDPQPSPGLDYRPCPEPRIPCHDSTPFRPRLVARHALVPCL